MINWFQIKGSKDVLLQKQLRLVTSVVQRRRYPLLGEGFSYRPSKGSLFSGPMRRTTRTSRLRTLIISSLSEFIIEFLYSGYGRVQREVWSGHVVFLKEIRGRGFSSLPKSVSSHSKNLSDPYLLPLSFSPKKRDPYIKL